MAYIGKAPEIERQQIKKTEKKAPACIIKV
jgi:hypothetical protein